MVEIGGPWKNYGEIEENFTLDELTLTLTAINKRNHSLFRMMGAVQGLEIDEIPDHSDEQDMPLPPEIAKMEEEFNRKKREIQSKGGHVEDWSGIQIGFASDGFDQI